MVKFIKRCKNCSHCKADNVRVTCYRYVNKYYCMKDTDYCGDRVKANQLACEHWKERVDSNEG